MVVNRDSFIPLYNFAALKSFVECRKEKSPGLGPNPL